jgi:hypothetical protein
MKLRLRFVLTLALLTGMIASGCSNGSSSSPEGDTDATVSDQRTEGEIVIADKDSEQDRICFPVCEGLSCGDDGCGSTCGECEAGFECADGNCVCAPSCEALVCGDDGCGGSCGECEAGLDCVDGSCACTPMCENLECGDDGCEGSCGECADGHDCEDGKCLCTPDCEGLECGDDKCGDSCGDCPENHDCSEGMCQCVPSCEDLECGDDGCGGSCGECTDWLSACVDGACLQAPSLGLSCSSDADCPADDFCLLGMCTRDCVEDGEPVENACADVAADSMWGTAFACAADLGLCLPGPEEGLNLLCKTTADCDSEMLAGTVCSGLLPPSDAGVFGLCLPASNLLPPGEPCQQDNDCSTLLCLHYNLDPSNPRICSSHCSLDDDCPPTTLCSLYPMTDEQGGQTFTPLCIPLTGGLDTCDTNGDCQIGKEYCGAVFSSDGESSSLRCLDSANPQGVWTGGLCSTSADCLEPYCVFETWSANIDAYCSHPCIHDSQCPMDLKCRPVHVEPFGNVWPESPYVLSMCVKVTQGSPCFVSEEGVCEFEWSECVEVPGGVGWVGQCESGQCPPSCQGKTCKQDNGCGEPCLDACLTNGTECSKLGQCLSGFCVDGVCCAGPCDGLCESCAVPDFVGTCSALPVGEDPEDECGACDRCNGLGGCVPIQPGPEPKGICDLCHVCDGIGECIPASALTDPGNDCGPCQFCDGLGQCVPIPYGADPKESCSELDKSTCSNNGNCDGTGQCALWPSMTLCGEPSCVGVKYAPAPHCDGDGKCLVQQFETCVPYGCNPESPECLTSCTLHSHCADDHWCKNGTCENMPSCVGGQKLICNASLPANTTDSPDSFMSYDSCVGGVPYQGGDKLYMVNTSEPTRISVTIEEHAFDVALALLSGACDSNAACVSFADQMPTGMVETLSFDTLPDTQYYLIVDGVAAQDVGSMVVNTECCVLQCEETNACGDDGCEGSCGTCEPQSLCVTGQCQECAPEDGLVEPNEACETAFAITEGEWDGLLCPVGDEDWYSVELLEGDDITLLLDFDAESVDFDLEFYGPDCGQPIAVSVNPDETEMVEKLIFNPGLYHIRVFTPGDSQGTYSLSLLIQETECSTSDDCPLDKVCALYQCTEPPAPCPATGKLLCGLQFEGDSTGGESGLEEYTSCTDDVLTGPETIYTMGVLDDTIVTLTLSGLPSGGAIAVLEQYCASEWACQTLGTGSPGVAAQAVVKMVPGIAYYVLAEGLDEDDAGAFLLNVDCCIPQCDDLECGDDGCGSDCGPCVGTHDACIEGACICQPDCTGLTCGDDGCGGSCGECQQEQHICEANQCLCVPACDGLDCGDDGCEGSCGECEEDNTGCLEGLCQCLPQCDGIECGDDGCGGECGPCQGPQELCVEGLCECQPSCLGKVCGDDGCGGSCGVCEGPQETCSNGFCVCQPECPPLACGDDGCGGNCGDCPVARTCAEAQCLCISEESEPNSACNQAKGLPPGLYEDLAVCPAGDEDWFAFILQTGQKLTVTALFEHDSGDLEMFLYDQSACSSYLKSSTSSTDNETISFVAPVNGTYTVRIMEFAQEAENSYSLQVSIE